MMTVQDINLRRLRALLPFFPSLSSRYGAEFCLSRRRPGKRAAADVLALKLSVLLGLARADLN